MRTFRFPVLVIAFFLPIFTFGQTLAEELFHTHEKYKESSITQRRFKHKDILPLIQQLKTPFDIKKVGASMEGRDIFLVKIGTGKTKVLLWSQMHGDESTATMALFDIFNLFGQKEDFLDWKKDILEELTIYFIPMLNPDGAEHFQRRTAFNVDLNRDALRLQTPEAQILKNIRDEIEADWGFNLHDQSRYNSVGNTNKTATISFLAPAFNYEKDINEVRKRAMQEIGLMKETLQQFMPGHIAKYNDDFEPRAFGDNIQKWGTSTILIESGGYKNDREKQFIRKMNYVALLTAFDDIAHQKYAKNSINGYKSILFNARYFHELLIRNATIIKNGKSYLLDIGFKQNEVQFNNAYSYYDASYISDMGDLSPFFGYKEFDATGYTIESGKLYPKKIRNWKQFKKLDLTKLHQQGFTTVCIKKYKHQNREEGLPIEIISTMNSYKGSIIHPHRNPSFFLIKEGTKKKIVLNGKIIDSLYLK